MILKIAVENQFKMKMTPSFRTIIFPEKPEVHYIGGTDVLPAPLNNKEEEHFIQMLASSDSEKAKKVLIEHNLRLVVYIAKKFDNTGVGVVKL